MTETQHTHMNSDPMPTVEENREHITDTHDRAIPSWANTPELEHAYHAHLHGIEMPGTPGWAAVEGQYERNVAELNRILGRPGEIASLVQLGKLLVRLLVTYDRRHDEVKLERPVRAGGVVMQPPMLTLELNNVEITMAEWDVLAPVLGLKR